MVEVDGGGAADETGAEPSPEVDDDAAAEASPVEDALSEASPGDDAAAGAEGAVPPPAATALTWSEVTANILEGDIVSIWGTSGTDVYVGTDLKSVYSLRSGVSTWTGVSTDVVGGGWGSDPSTVYAVGASAWLAQLGVSSGGGLFRYKDRGIWTSVAAGTFYSVWGSSAHDVYVVGEAGVLHSIDGSSFASEGAAGGNVLSVWGSGPNDVYVATANALGTILHSAGDGNWRPAYTEPTSRAWAVWGSGPGDVYAVLSPASAGDPNAHLVHSMPDGSWAGEAVSQEPTTLVALWGSGAHDVYAGGWHAGAAGRSGALYRSSGDGRWSPVDLPGKPYDVRCIWGSSPIDVYVGVFDVSAGPVLLHGQR
jgi:hypothetical protein